MSVVIPLVIAASTVAACAGTKTVMNADFQNGCAGWYIYGSPATAELNPVDDAILTGKALKLAATYRALATNFDAVTLADGESLMLSLDFHFLSAPPAGKNYLQVYLGNQSKVGATLAADTDAAYLLAVNTDPAATVRQLIHDPGTSGGILAGADRKFVSAQSGNSQVITEASKHKLKFTVTRSGAKYILSGGVDGEVLTVTGDAALSFNVLGVGISNSNGVPFAIDNVKLEHVTK